MNALTPSRTTPFATEREVEDYFATSLMECLECGKWYALLSKHLVYAHVGMDRAAYSRKWGLPWSRGLCGAEHRARMRAVALANPWVDSQENKDLLALQRKRPRRARRPSSKVVRAKTRSSLPRPTGAQAAPSQRAMRLAVTPPAVVNRPPR